MSYNAKHVARHRAPTTSRAPRAKLGTALTLSSLAVLATGLTIGGGVVALSAESASGTGESASLTGAAANLTQTAQRASDATETTDESRGEVVSRSDRRRKADPLKTTSLTLDGANAMTRSEDLSTGDPRVIAMALLTEFGYAKDQFGCLDSLWERESHWNPRAANPSSGAYGIPQSLPGSKMATVAADWRTNPITQIRWGLGYIQDRYGSPCGAWGHSQSHGWY